MDSETDQTTKKISFFYSTICRKPTYLRQDCMEIDCAPPELTELTEAALVELGLVAAEAPPDADAVAAPSAPEPAPAPVRTGVHAHHWRAGGGPMMHACMGTQAHGRARFVRSSLQSTAALAVSGGHAAWLAQRSTKRRAAAMASGTASSLFPCKTLTTAQSCRVREGAPCICGAPQPLLRGFIQASHLMPCKPNRLSAAGRGAEG